MRSAPDARTETLGAGRPWTRRSRPSVRSAKVAQARKGEHAAEEDTAGDEQHDVSGCHRKLTTEPTRASAGIRDSSGSLWESMREPKSLGVGGHVEVVVVLALLLREDVEDSGRTVTGGDDRLPLLGSTIAPVAYTFSTDVSMSTVTSTTSSS